MDAVFVTGKDDIDDVKKSRRNHSFYGNMLMYDDNVKNSSPFYLSESDLLACAKEIILACNRTQSGGDTYDSVNCMLCNYDYAVITPFTSEADPMEINVEVIQRDRAGAIVHNAWLQKPIQSKEYKVKGMIPKKILSPFKMGGSPFRNLNKSKQGDETKSSVSPGYSSNSKSEVQKSSAMQRTQLIESIPPTSDPISKTDRSNKFDDADVTTTDDEIFGDSIIKVGSRDDDTWTDPTKNVPDFSKPLGLGENDYESSPRVSVSKVSSHLPPPTWNNHRRGGSANYYGDDSSNASGSSGDVPQKLSLNFAAGGKKTEDHNTNFGESPTINNNDDKDPNITNGSKVNNSKSKFWKKVGLRLGLSADHHVEDDDKADTDKSRLSTSSANSRSIRTESQNTSSLKSKRSPASPDQIGSLSISPSVDSGESFSAGEYIGSPNHTSENRDKGVTERGVNNAAPFIYTDKPMCIRVEVREI